MFYLFCYFLQNSGEIINNMYVKKYHIIYGKILAQILSNVMEEADEGFLAIITDASFDQTIASTVADGLRTNGYFVDMHVSRIKDDLPSNVDYDIQDIIARSIKVVVLLLPSQLSESAISVADSNFIRTRQSTWITIDSSALTSQYKCIHNIEMTQLMNSMHEDWIIDAW